MKKCLFALVLMALMATLTGCTGGNEKLLIEKVAELNAQIATTSQIMTGLGIAVIVIGGSFAVSMFKLLRKERG